MGLRSIQRLAIIGGGMGGVATAWFCDPECSVSLFEAKAELGGNCVSETIGGRNGDLIVDLGAQFFHPRTHPTYIALLELLELLELSQPVGGARSVERFEIPADLSVHSLDGSDPFFSSMRAIRTPLHALEFLVYCRAARKMAFGGDYNVTMGDWVESLQVSQRFKTHILLPWLTASEGHPLEHTKRSSARAILQLFAPSHPRSPLEKATTWSSRVGFQGHIIALARQLEDTTVHTQSPVLRIEKVDDAGSKSAGSESAGSESGWFVFTPNGRSGPFDAVVINAPPWETKKIIDRLPWAGDLVALLDRYEFLSHKLTVHSDPTYVHTDRRHWGLANVGVDKPDNGPEQSELSVWLGAGLARSNGKPVDVFKSWTTYRRQDPKQVLFERTFQHSIKTPNMMNAARSLGAWQGKEGLWFAGHFTSGIDLQESALCSAMDVAAALCPSSPTLSALKAQMRSRVEPASRYSRAAD